MKSCMITRAGVNWISMLGSAEGSQLAIAADVIRGDVGAVFGAEKVLGENLQGIGQFLGAGDGREAEDLVRVLTDLEGSLGSE